MHEVIAEQSGVASHTSADAVICMLGTCAATTFLASSREAQTKARATIKRYVLRGFPLYKAHNHHEPRLQGCHARRPAMSEPGNHVEARADEHAREVCAPSS